MTIQEAKEILGDSVQEDGSLYDLSWYLCCNAGAPDATLDGKFTADELEAISVLMKSNSSQE